MATEKFANQGAFTIPTLAADIVGTGRPVVFTVSGTTGHPTSAQFRVLIDSEILLVTNVAGTTYTGAAPGGNDTTTAATHSAGAQVRHIPTADSIQNIPGYAANPHGSSGHSGSVFPAANQTLQGNLDGDGADTRSIGTTNRLNVVNAKSIRTQDVAGATPTLSNGDLAIGTNAIWAQSGGTRFKVTPSAASSAPIATYLFEYDGANYIPTNLWTLDTSATNADCALAWNQMNSAMSTYANPGGKVIVAPTAANAVYDVKTTLFTCPGTWYEGPGGGKRGTQNGRNVGTVFQADTAFVGSPMWSWVNQTLMQAPTTAPTLALTTAGSMTPGVHYVAYSWLANNGGESPLSPANSVTTTSSNNKINVTLPAFPSWAVSANIYITLAGNQWAAAHAYAVGDIVTQLAGSDNGHQFKVTSISGTGTSAGSEPTWNLGASATTTDNPGANQVVWTEFGPNSMRRVSGTARNDQFYLDQNTASTTPTITHVDTNAAIAWNGVGKYSNTNVLLDTAGVFDYTHPYTPTTWQSNTAYQLGDTVKPTISNAHVFRCISPGGSTYGWAAGVKSGGSEPTWQTGTDAVTLDGTIAWQECGSDAAGTLANGTYSWVVTATFTSGVYSGTEREISPISTLTIAGGAKQVCVGLPLAPAGCSKRTVYRTATGGTQLKKVADVSNNTTIGYMDAIADGSLGANITATIPVVLPSEREALRITQFTIDCNGNAAGTQGADIGWIANGAGAGNALMAWGVTVMNFNVTGFRLGWCGKDDASSDVWGDDLFITQNKGTTGNVNANVQINSGDSALGRCNFANMAGANTGIGVHVRGVTANIRLLNYNHIGGGGGGMTNIMVEAVNSLWLDSTYIDGLSFAAGGIWFRPVTNTSIGRCSVKESNFNHNADVPWITLDGGRPSLSGGKSCSWLWFSGNKSPGATTQVSAMIRCLNAYPNAKGLFVAENIGATFKKSSLIDSSQNGNTVSADWEWGNTIDTAGSQPTNMLSEQWGTVTFSASTTATFNHNLRATPTFVVATGNSATPLSFAWTATSTQITLTASASNSQAVSWHALVKG